MAAQQFSRTLCEDSQVEGVDWSEWVTVLVPRPEATQSRQFTKRSLGNIGYYYKAWAEDPALKNHVYCCGIFEFQLVRDGKELPVYLNSTHLSKPHANLKEFIHEYLVKGSNKQALINKAILRRWALQVRMFGKNIFPSHEDNKRLAEKMENKLLQRYDYWWNVRLNMDYC